MPVVLEKMTPTAFDAYVKDSIREYAEYMVMQREYPNVAIALKAAEAEIIPYYKNLKPNEKTFAYHIINGETGERMGYLVYSHLSSREPGKMVAFIDFIKIDQPYQRQGYARQAMEIIEKDIHEAGIRIIDLNVMLHKLGAQALYSGLGYQYQRPRYLGPNPREITRFDMRKILS